MTTTRRAACWRTRRTGSPCRSLPALWRRRRNQRTAGARARPEPVEPGQPGGRWIDSAPPHRDRCRAWQGARDMSATQRGRTLVGCWSLLRRPAAAGRLRTVRPRWLGCVSAGRRSAASSCGRRRPAAHRNPGPPQPIDPTGPPDPVARRHRTTLESAVDSGTRPAGSRHAMPTTDRRPRRPADHRWSGRGHRQRFTIAFAGDVNFAERTADRLAADPDTAFGVAAPGLAAADLTVVNLETAITTGGEPEPKSFTFRAPPSALHRTAGGRGRCGLDGQQPRRRLRRRSGCADSVAAIAAVGIPGHRHRRGRQRRRWRRTATTIKGVTDWRSSRSARCTTTPCDLDGDRTTPGIASAFDPRLVDNVRRRRPPPANR